MVDILNATLDGFFACFRPLMAFFVVMFVAAIVARIAEGR